MTILEEFLVKLGFTVDKDQEEKFKGSASEAAKSVEKIGKKAVGMGTAVAASILKASSELSKMKFSAELSGTTIKNARAMGLAFKNMGLDSGQAAQTMAGLRARLTDLPPLRDWVASTLGVKTIDKTTGKLRDMSDILVDLGKSFERMPSEWRTRYAEVLGISREIAETLADPNLRKEYVKQRKQIEKFGIDLDKSAKKTERFVKNVNAAWEQVKLTSLDALTSAVGEQLDKFMDKFPQMLGSFYENLKESLITIFNPDGDDGRNFFERVYDEIINRKFKYIREANADEKDKTKGIDAENRARQEDNNTYVAKYGAAGVSSDTGERIETKAQEKAKSLTNEYLHSDMERFKQFESTDDGSLHWYDMKEGRRVDVEELEKQFLSALVRLKKVDAKEVTGNFVPTVTLDEKGHVVPAREDTSKVLSETAERNYKRDLEEWKADEKARRAAWEERNREAQAKGKTIQPYKPKEPPTKASLPGVVTDIAPDVLKFTHEQSKADGALNERLQAPLKSQVPELQEEPKDKDVQVTVLPDAHDEVLKSTVPEKADEEPPKIVETNNNRTSETTNNNLHTSVERIKDNSRIESKERAIETNNNRLSMFERLKEASSSKSKEQTTETNNNRLSTFDHSKEASSSESKERTTETNNNRLTTFDRSKETSSIESKERSTETNNLNNEKRIVEQHGPFEALVNLFSKPDPEARAKAEKRLQEPVKAFSSMPVPQTWAPAGARSDGQSIVADSYLPAAMSPTQAITTPQGEKTYASYSYESSSSNVVNNNTQNEGAKGVTITQNISVVGGKELAADTGKACMSGAQEGVRNAKSIMF